jgi:hypothetical protein
MKLRLFLIMITLCSAGSAAHAQVERFFQPTNPAGADWYVSSNWSDNLAPSREFSEIGSVTLGRYAYVNTARANTIFDGVDADPGEIRLGVTGGGGPNILEIRNGGTMRVELVSGDLTDGGIEVGSPNGNGTLRVLPGGSLTVDGTIGLSFTAAPFGPSQFIVGGAATGTATVNAGSGNFAGVSQFFANSDVNFSNALTFGAQSQFRPEIRGVTTNAKVDVTNIALLDGVMTVDFTGFSPTPGQTWTLIDAADIQGGFDAVNSPQVGLGAALITSVVPVSGREQLRVTYNTSLVLRVNRDTGAVVIDNPNAPGIAIDGYSIRSASSKLNPTNWTSLDDGNLLGGDWRESNPAETRLTELKPAGSGTVAGNSTISLGNIYDPNSSAFTSGEDLVFDYTNQLGQVITGQIVYTGTRVNNLLLQVDPGTGEARLRNTSATTVNIDGYDIGSASGSLVLANWNTFDESGTGGTAWVPSSGSDANNLSELNPINVTAIAPGASIPMGNIFNTSGTQDLVFRFLQGTNQFPTTGVVMYTAFATAVDGDFDNDGDVDGRDFLIWQRGGSPNGVGSASDLALWKANYGFGTLSAVSATTAVPEPTSLLLTVVGFGLSYVLKRDGSR